MKKLLLLISMTVCFAAQSTEQEQQTSDTSSNIVDTDTDTDTNTKHDITTRDDKGYTILHHAIRAADFETVVALLDDPSLDLTVTTPPTEDLSALSPLLLAAETWQGLEEETPPPFEISLRQTNEQKKSALLAIITLLKGKDLIASVEEIQLFESRHPNSFMTSQITFSLSLSPREMLSQMQSLTRTLQGSQTGNQD